MKVVIFLYMYRYIQKFIVYTRYIFYDLHCSLHTDDASSISLKTKTIFGSTALLRLLFVWHYWYKLVAKGVLVLLQCTIGFVRLHCKSVNPEISSLAYASSAQRQYSFKKRSSLENMVNGENSSSSEFPSTLVKCIINISNEQAQ
jgi:hypothetical protein